jgi:hypothetical protein
MTHQHPENAATVVVNCQRCKQPFTARVADRKRGWGKFCSKSCKAIKQTQKTGWSGPGSGPRPGGKGRYPRHDGMSPMKHKFCYTCGAPAINGVYTNDRDRPIEWGCALHHDTSHPFSSDALGQW